MTLRFVVVHYRAGCAVMQIDDAPVWTRQHKKQRRVSSREVEIKRYVTPRELTREQARQTVAELEARA